MYKKFIALITLTSFVFYLHGCYSTRQIPRETFENQPEYTITALITIEGKLIEFKSTPAVDIKNKIITGFSKDRTPVNIPFSQIAMVYFKKFDPVATTFAVIGTIAILFVVTLALIALLKESCPFVYSHDGEQYVFDGEPYGGAICKGLQRTDLCRLEHLLPQNDEYRLLLTNEVNETQYTDEFKLWVVDHPEGVDVIQDAFGDLFTIDSLRQPLWVVDNKGENWFDWLSKKDLIYWESDVLSKDPNKTSDLRDTLFMAFSKPADVTTAKLVVHGCNTLWGSHMLRRMVELGGDQVNLWYESHNIPAQKERREAWNDREEIFELQVYLWINDTWVKRGEILGGGPFMAEERVVPLDLTDIEGDTLKVRLIPPTGFWKLNSFFADYSQDVLYEFQEISADSMIGHDGTDLRTILDSTDGDYYIMPEVGQRATLTFSVPPSKPGLKRTLFAKVSGYYDMYLDASGPPQLEIISRISSEPGFVTKFSLNEYFKWRSEQLAKAKE